MPIGDQKTSEKFTVLGTKISPETAELLNTICQTMQVDAYHLMQWFVYTLIKASSPQHELTPEIRKIMALLEADTGWQQAFNLANPQKLRVAQVVLILEQENHKGFGAVRIDKPWMGQSTQTECVDDILERVTEVTMHGIYRRLRLLGGSMGAEHLSDILLTMIEDQINMDQERSTLSELQGPDNVAGNGRPYAYGAKTKTRQHRSPDSLAASQQPLFPDLNPDGDGTL